MPDLYLDVDTALSEVPVNIMPLIDDTDFKTRETAVAYNAAGMDLVWNFVSSAGSFTQTAVTPTTSGDYDWTHQGDGMYTIEIPASGGASINNDTEGYGWFTGIVTGVLPFRGPVIGFRASGLNDKLCDNAYSTTRGLAGTALPDAAADAAGGLVISDAGGFDIDNRSLASAAVTNANTVFNTDFATNYNGTLDQWNVNIESWNATAVPSEHTAGYPIVTIKDGTGTGEINTNAGAVALVDLVTSITNDPTGVGTLLTRLGTPSNLGGGATISANLVDIEGQTDDIGTAGAGLTAIPWNASWDAEVQSEVDDGLVARNLHTIEQRLRGLVMAQGTIGSTGNTTTTIHLTGLTYGDNELNDYLLVIFDVSESEYHARWIEAWANTGDLATVATLPFTPQDATDTYWVLPIRQDVSGGSGLDAAGVRAAIGMASANLDSQLSAIDDYVDTEVSAIKAKTDQLTFGVTNTLNVNLTHSLGVAVVNSDFTIASATSSTVTLPTTYTSGSSLPDDDRYEYNVLSVVGGTGVGQTVLLTTAGASARQYNVLTATMPVQLDNTSECVVLGAWRANTTHLSGTLQTARDIGTSVLLSSGTGTGQILLSSGTVTVGTNSDKTGYSLTQSFPSNFAALGINASGHVSRVTLVDTTTTNTDMITASGIRSAVGLGSANLDTQLSAIDDYVDSEVAAIKAVTDKLDTALELDGAVYRYTVNALEQAPSGGGGTADWNTDERTAIRTILGIPASGTTPEAPTAGALKVIDDFLDTEVAAILADTNELQTDWANGGRLDLILDARASQISVDTIDDFLDTEVAAIKAKTDLIPASPASTSDVTSIWTTAMTESYNADGSAPTPVQALYAILQRLTDFSISGTSLTVRKLDGSTTAFVLTLNDATTPTASTRSS